MNFSTGNFMLSVCFLIGGTAISFAQRDASGREIPKSKRIEKICSLDQKPSDSLNKPLEVIFIDFGEMDTTIATGWVWDFSDGITAIEKQDSSSEVCCSILATLSENPQYTVTVTDGSGCCTIIGTPGPRYDGPLVCESSSFVTSDISGCHCHWAMNVCVCGFQPKDLFTDFDLLSAACLNYCYVSDYPLLKPLCELFSPSQEKIISSICKSIKIQKSLVLTLPGKERNNLPEGRQDHFPKKDIDLLMNNTITSPRSRSSNKE
ncbi:MAG: hypothetical protein IAF38_09225 [Bacteroidia bacterium]|nr:hypothetical protein [Bacteroidia bacterium]